MKPGRTLRSAVTIVLAAAMAITAFAGPAGAAPFMATAPGNLTGWTRDFVDDFDGPLNTAAWSRYESSTNQIGMLSKYNRANVYTENGNMVLRTYDAGGGDWRAAGVSGNPGFAAAQGKWVIRAKFDRAPGLGYAFLLYPRGGGWPPEVDIAEGTAGGPRVMSTLHWSPSNLTDSRFKTGIDMTQWHTYGVVLSDDKVEFTVDGAVWTTINNTGSPRMPMWLGLQTGAKANVPGVTGEVVDATTPPDAHVYIDYVAHWKATN
jgi:beta-glucanase (GH16 family)